MKRRSAQPHGPYGSGKDFTLLFTLLTVTTTVNPDWFYLPGFTFLVPAYPDSPEQNPRGP